MAKVFIQESTLTAIGDAIRNKTGKTALINPTNMATEIASIESGSSEPSLEEQSHSITANGYYVYEPSASSDGISYIELDVNVPTSSEPVLQKKPLNITANGVYDVKPDTGYDGLSLVRVTALVEGSEPMYGDWQDIEEPAGSEGWANSSAAEDNIYLIGNVAGLKHIKFKYNHMMNGTVESIAFEIPDSNPNGTNATFYIGILDLSMAYLHLYLDGDSFNLYAKDPDKSGALMPRGGGLICYLKYATAS